MTQEQFAALIAKTDFGKFAKFARDYVRKHGPAAWQRLAKDATTQGFTTTTGLVFYDLRQPAYLIDQAYTPILNSTPRWGKENAGYGVQPNWKAVTAFDATNVAPFVSEGNRNGYSSVTEKNFSAPYITLGSDDFVTFEAESASMGYDNNLGTAKEVQLIRFRRNQESTYLGGAGTLGANGNPLQLGTMSTPTGALTASTGPGGAKLATGTYAAAYCVALSYRAVANPNNSVSAGITTQYGRASADGSATDVINGGTSIVSAVSNVAGPTVSGTPNVLFTATPKAGAWGYAWFVQSSGSTFTPAPGSALLTSISSASYLLYYGQTQGTQAASYSGSGGYVGFATDCSTNQLDMDGLLTIASNSNYTTGLPTPNFTSGVSWAGNVTALAGGVDLHGAGLTNGGFVGSIAEFDNILYAIQAATKTSPTKIYISTDVVNTFTKAFMSGATSSTAINFFFPQGGQGSDGLAIETHVAKYHNRFALAGGQFVDVIQHPYLPTGTVLFDVDSLGVAYQHSRLGETRGVFTRRDTYGIEFAQTTRKYPFGVYSEEVLAVKTPHILGYLKSVGPFGQTAQF